MPEGACIFCISDMTIGSSGVEPERILKAYDHWYLIIQSEPKRRATVEAAGLLVSRRHHAAVSEATAVEFGEIPAILHDASARLCEAAGTVYTGQTRLGFNEGADAGQTVMHAHLHLLPVSESDPAPLKIRGGIGGAFEALRTARLGKVNK
jgi:diadenosine tetraphosphate (Ap4A) HIT family hydrolase